MPVTQQRSRKQIRQSVGLVLGALDMSDGVLEKRADDSGGLLTIRDNSLIFGTRDEHKGKWVQPVGTTDSGETRQVQESRVADRALVMNLQFSSQTDTNFVYELWKSEYPPALVHEFINMAITDVTRKGSVPTDTTYLHTGGNIYTFYLPATMTGVQDVFMRESFEGIVLNNCDDSFANPQANVTVVADGQDKREGSASNRLTIAAAFTTGQVANDTFGAVNISGMTHVEAWVKSTVATDTQSLDIVLNSSGVEQLSLPALGADSWTYLRLPLANPESDSAITSVRLHADSDFGAAVVWQDGIRAVRDRSETWGRIHTRFWRLNRDQRQIVFQPDAVSDYALLNVVGVRVPDLLTSDTDICEVDSQYVVNKTAAALLRLRAADPVAQGRANTLETLAQQALVRMETPRPAVRWVDQN